MLKTGHPECAELLNRPAKVNNWMLEAGSNAPPGVLPHCALNFEVESNLNTDTPKFELCVCVRGSLATWFLFAAVHLLSL